MRTAGGIDSGQGTGIQMQTVEAVIFDLDGVITSTDEFHYLAWKKIFDNIGIKFDRHANQKIKGVGRRESFETIAASGDICGFR